MCDVIWGFGGEQIDPDMVSSNGIEMGSQRDMLRLDALIMTVQLNLRKLLEAAPARLPLCAWLGAPTQTVHTVLSWADHTSPPCFKQLGASTHSLHIVQTWADHLSQVC